MAQRCALVDATSIAARCARLSPKRRPAVSIRDLGDDWLNIWQCHLFCDPPREPPQMPENRMLIEAMIYAKTAQREEAFNNWLAARCIPDECGSVAYQVMYADYSGISWEDARADDVAVWKAQMAHAGYSIVQGVVHGCRLPESPEFPSSRRYLRERNTDAVWSALLQAGSASILAREGRPRRQDFVSTNRGQPKWQTPRSAR